MKVIKSSNFIESSGGGGGSGGGLTTAQVQALIDNAGHADEAVVASLTSDVAMNSASIQINQQNINQNTQDLLIKTQEISLLDTQVTNNSDSLQVLESKERHTNVATDGLAAYDPFRSFVTTFSASWRWFKIADLGINGTYRGFILNYSLLSRYVQSHGAVRLIATNTIDAIQFLNSKVGIGTTQLVLMREDTNPENYHILLKVGSYNHHVALSQEVFRTRVDANLYWNVDYQETSSVANSTTTQTVTDYTGFTQVASLVI